MVAGGRGWRDVEQHFGEQLAAHLLAHVRGHCERGGQEGAYLHGQPVGQPRDVGLHGPGVQVRRHRHRRLQLGAHPVAHHIGARGHVAQPLGPRVDDRGHDSRDAVEQVDLDEADEATGQRVPEGDRAGVVAHRAQAGSHLAHRAALSEGLHGHRVADRGRDHTEQDDGLTQRCIGAHDNEDHEDHQHVSRGAHDQVVEQSREHSQPDRGCRQLQRHRLAGDEVVLTDADGGDAPFAHAPPPPGALSVFIGSPEEHRLHPTSLLG